MATLPWTAVRVGAGRTATEPTATEPTATEPTVTEPAVVMASEFRLTSLRRVPGFFLAAMRIRRQVLASDGALGVSLVAKPFARRFWTLSAWRDRAALDAFVGQEPHRSTMRRFRPAMAQAKFVFWESDALPVPWEEARGRLATAPDRAR